MSQYSECKKSRFNIFPLLRLLFSVILLYLIFSNLDIGIVSLFHNNTKLWILLSIIFLGVLQWHIEFLRFYLVIKPCLKQVDFKKLVQVFFVGYTFRFILPGGLGEIGKMLFIPGTYTYRLSVYCLEKIIHALSILFMLGFAGFYIFPAKGYYILLLLLIIPGAIIAFIFMTKERYIKKIILSNYPYKKLIFQLAILSLFQLGIIISQYWLLLYEYGISYISTAAVVIIILSVIMIPVTFAGLGLREMTALKLFSIYDIPAGIGATVSLLVFMVNIMIPAIIGGIVLFFTKLKVEKISNNDDESIKARINKIIWNPLPWFNKRKTCRPTNKNEFI